MKYTASLLVPVSISLGIRAADSKLTHIPDTV